MKKVNIPRLVIAIVLIFVLLFVPLSQINDHTYTIGVDNYHIENGCLRTYPTHLKSLCNYYH